jgi:4-hydroxybenzoate polyprenyltransferase
VSAPGSTVARLVVLARPKGAWLIACLPLIGFGYGLWERGSTVALGVVAPTLALLWLAWVVGHAGAMWLNAVLDRDHGPVLLGRAVPVPRGTALAGYLALAGSVAIAIPLGTIAAACAAACALLSILYSHPRVALKGRPIGGPLVNGFGYGALSPIAGWSAADVTPTWRAGITLAFTVLLILGVYFSAQAFQADEDRRRGYRTLVATHGPRWTLTVTRACFRVSVIGLLVLTLVGAYPRLFLVSVPVWWWVDRHVTRWRRLDDGGDGRWAAGLVGRMAVGAIVVVIAAYVHHFDRIASSEPPGGCGTAWVPAALADVCGDSPHAPPS